MHGIFILQCKKIKLQQLHQKKLLANIYIYVNLLAIYFFPTQITHPPHQALSCIYNALLTAKYSTTQKLIHAYNYVC